MGVPFVFNQLLLKVTYLFNAICDLGIEPSFCTVQIKISHCLYLASFFFLVLYAGIGGQILIDPTVDMFTQNALRRSTSFSGVRHDGKANSKLFYWHYLL